MCYNRHAELSYVPVSLGREYKLCPLFPGFYYCWDGVYSQEKAVDLIKQKSGLAFLLEADQFFSE